MKVKVLIALSYLTLSALMDCSSSVHEIIQARILEWVSIPFSRGSSQPGDLNPGLLCCRQILYCLKKNLSILYLIFIFYPLIFQQFRKTIS